MHIYLIKNRLNNEIVHVFGACDNDNAFTIMYDYYGCIGSEYYLERISSYTTSGVEIILMKNKYCVSLDSELVSQLKVLFPYSRMSEILAFIATKYLEENKNNGKK